MDIPYSPTNKNNIMIRLGINKKKHIVKGIRYIKTEIKNK